MKVYVSELTRRDESIVVGVYSTDDRAWAASIFYLKNNAAFARWDVQTTEMEYDAMPVCPAEYIAELPSRD